ncbi:MAG TPA: phage virion morphogenesis protein [Armatimonadota bacterium]|nr:phage virion morphogenesis protein [Armatimonadota bacterium]
MSAPGTTAARVSFRVSVLGEMQLHRALQGRIRATSDLSPAFERIADDFEETEQRQFESEGGFEGNPGWAPLSEKYAAWKAKKYPGGRILTATGKLRDALTGGAGSIRKVDPLRLEVGGSVIVGKGRRWDLGALHQTGTTRGMPARKPINLSRNQRHRLIRFLTDHLRLEGRD